MALRSRNILSLCAGVGGIELGIALALHHRGETARGICYVEREAAAAASLVASMDAGWFHPAPVWSDLTTFDARPWRGLVQILASGDPCQENSVAGKRAGADGVRFLAPEVVRIADECRPNIIFRENVPGNADGQLAAIVPPLEGMGYRVAAGIFSSAETGNSMRRERLFIMAERADIGHERGWHAWRRRTGPADGGERMGLPQGIGPGEGGTEHAREQGRRAATRSGGELAGSTLPPAVIPGPTDSRWIDVLDRWPELQPALSQEEAERIFRGSSDALAHRVERLRATGNGVDPVTAAWAWINLSGRLRDVAADPVHLSRRALLHADRAARAAAVT